MNIKKTVKTLLLKNNYINKKYEKYQDVKRERDFQHRYDIRDTQRMIKLKASKIGKRCFIIGNGPSLRIDDLERIKDEDSFGVNSIYRIFGRTSWSPTYYVSQDREVLERIKGDIGPVIDCCEQVFLNSSVLDSIDKTVLSEKIHFFFLNTKDRDLATKNVNPLFSDDVTEQIYEGHTVTYGCIQLAVYMGYSEIYLLGIDHSYNITRNLDGTISENSSITKNYMVGMEAKLDNIPELEKTTLAYRVARHVCDEKGIVIKNATRGGKLEEFERIEFDSLF